MTPLTLEDVWRREATHVLGALVRKYGDFDGCEDACQEAVATAAEEWPRTGRSDNPRAWLIRVASRRLVDARRSDRSRAQREQRDAARDPADAMTVPSTESAAGSGDDTLQLLVLCCHPALTKASHVVLTLRAVGGLTTEQIARFLRAHGDHGATHQPCEGAHPSGRGTFRGRACRCRPIGGGVARALPGVQRGLHDERRRSPQSMRRPQAGNAPTGRRSSCCIGCSTALHRARWSR